MPRRGENIYKRKDGRWEGRYMTYEHSGTQKKYRSIYGKTYSEVKHQLFICKQNEQIQSTPECKLTVSELMENWLAKKKTRVKPSSYYRYQALIRLHILPQLGTTKVNDLNAEMLEDFVSDKIVKGRVDGCGGLSAKTVNNIVIIIKSALSMARIRFSLKDCGNISAFSAPTVTQVKIETLGETDVNRISAIASTTADISEASVLLCLNTGLRLGELCGLRWSDIDVANNTLTVSRTVQRVNFGGYTALTLQDPKTKHSARTIPLPEEMTSFLIKLKGNTQSTTYVLTGADAPLDPRTMQYRFHAFLKRNNITRQSFHSLRHTFASRCIEAGMDAKCLCELLGHSNIKTTLQLYVHPSMKQKRAYLSEVCTLSKLA